MKMLIQFLFQHGDHSSCRCLGGRRASGRCVCGVTASSRKPARRGESLGAESQFPGLMASLIKPLPSQIDSVASPTPAPDSQGSG